MTMNGSVSRASCGLCGQSVEQDWFAKQVCAGRGLNEAEVGLVWVGLAFGEVRIRTRTLLLRKGSFRAQLQSVLAS